MSLFNRKKKEKKVPRILEGADLQWMDELPGEEYIHQNPRVRIGIASRIGTRTYQQDTAAVRWIDDSLLVAMICDGMGGLKNGEVASKEAIRSMMTGIEAASEEGVLTAGVLFDIVRDTNEMIREINEDIEDQISCGTTMTLLILKDDLAVWMSIGDSRIYYMSERGLKCVTKEHNYALMTEMRMDEASFTPDPKIREDSLVSFLGAPEIRYIDYNTRPWRLDDGDMFLMCSDGLVRLLEDQRIEQLLLTEGKDPDELASDLVEEAASNVVQRQDNTTVIILSFEE